MYNHQCARLVDAPFLHLIRWCLYHLSHNLPFYFNINRCSLVISTYTAITTILSIRPSLGARGEEILEGERGWGREIGGVSLRFSLLLSL